MPPGDLQHLIPLICKMGEGGAEMWWTLESEITSLESCHLVAV